MRRIFKGTAKLDKSAEKKQRDVLMRSITQEGQNKTRLIQEQKDLLGEIKGLAEVKKSEENKAAEVKAVKISEEKKLKEIQSKLIPLQSKLAESELKLQQLGRDYTQSQLDLEKVRHKNTQEYLLMCESHSKVLEQQTNEIKRIENNLKLKKLELSNMSANELRIGQEAEDKKREIVSLEKTLRLRALELSEMEKERKQASQDIVLTKKQLNNINVELDSVNNQKTIVEEELRNKTKEVKDRESEVETKRETLVALVTKEQRINELIPELKDLFAKAGINIKI